MGLSDLFRSPRIPLWISVENRVLEIVGLDSESGLEMGDFVSGISGHEGRSMGKSTTRGVHIIVSRIEKLQERNS
jgi:hypothetical protein